MATNPPVDPKPYRIRPLKRGDRETAFRLLAADGWVVPVVDQEAVLSWIVQHPEIESFVAHDTAAFSRIYGMIAMSHRPQLRLGGRVASIDLFVVAAEHRGKGIGHDLFAQSLRRAEALACKRIELYIDPAHEANAEFFTQQGFVKSASQLYTRSIRPLSGRG